MVLLVCFGRLGVYCCSFFPSLKSFANTKSRNKSLQHRSASLHWTVFKLQFCGSLRSLYRKTTTQKPPLNSALVLTMIEKISVTINFSGEFFSPSRAERETGLTLYKKKEVGDIGVSGKYKGIPIPYGSGNLEPPATLKDNEKILWLANTLETTLSKFIACGADEPHLYVGYFYKDQCNLTLSKKELAAIAKLGIDFCFSCYENTESE